MSKQLTANWNYHPSVCHVEQGVEIMFNDEVPEPVKAKIRTSRTILASLYRRAVDPRQECLVVLIRPATVLLLITHEQKQ